MYPGILRSGVTGTYHHRRWIRSLACFFHHGSIQTSGKSAPVSLCFAGQGHFGCLRSGINDPAQIFAARIAGADRVRRGGDQNRRLIYFAVSAGWKMRREAGQCARPPGVLLRLGLLGAASGRRGTGTGRERDHRAASTKLWKICLLWSSFKRENSGCHWTAQT